MRIKRKTLLLLILILLLVYQNPLENVNSAFGYIDESIALLGLIAILLNFNKFKKKNFLYEHGRIILLLFIYIGACVLGNIIYKYQPIKYVCIDLVANTKFYLAVSFGTLLYKGCIDDYDEKQVCKITRILSAVFVILFIIDRTTSVFGSSEIRYGIRSLQLNYSHSTYLCASLAALVLILVAFYEKRNLKYIITNSILMIFTLRAKAFGAVIALFILCYIFLVHKGKLKKWQLLVLITIGIIAAWDQIYFYFIQLNGLAARSIMMITSLKIMKDYFPIGSGFGTFASDVAGKYYSPVYYKYGFDKTSELSPMGWGFFNDQFWPIVFGQSGIIGTIAYVGILITYWRRIAIARARNKYVYCALLFGFIYLLISSVAEPAFNNSIACIFGLLFGILFRKYCCKS